MGIKKISGLSADTMRRLLYDAGQVWINYGTVGAKLIGATRGGNTVSIEPEYRKMPVDGQPGDVKGDKRIVSVSCKLTVNVIEMTTDAIMANLPGSANTPTGTHDVITGGDQIEDGDYFTNVTLVLEKAGTSALWGFKLKNAIALGSLSIGANENDEPVNTIEFTGHFDADDLETMPFEIFNPLEVAVTNHTLTYIAGANGQIIGNTVQTVASGSDGSPVMAVPATGYQFDAWSDAYATALRTDEDVSGNVTVTATFSEI